VVDASAMTDRVLLLVQIASVVLPLIIDLRKGRLLPALRPVSPGIVRTGGVRGDLRVGGGCVQRHFRLRGTNARAPRGHRQHPWVRTRLRRDGRCALCAALALIATPMIRWLRSARNGDPALLRAVRLVLTVLTISGIALLTLGSLGLTTNARAAFDSLLGVTLEVGSVAGRRQGGRDRNRRRRGDVSCWPE
jgi:hypothetical protein